MNSSTNSRYHQFWREKTGKITFLKSNTGVYTLYESHTKCVYYMAEEAGVLARITSKIKQFIQYYGFKSDCVLWWGV